jgi:hypothetical protein
MLRASKAISLFLVGSTTALLGYEAVAPSHSTWQNGYGPSTQPGGSYGGSGYHPYHSSGWFGYHNGSYGGSSGYHGSFSSHSGTSRGGFGSSGHSSGS